MGHLHRYVFSSCQRLTGGRLGLNLRISDSLRTIHFGPDQKPVIGPQILARDLAACSTLNCYAVGWPRNATGISVHPLAHLRRTHPNFGGKFKRGGTA